MSSEPTDAADAGGHRARLGQLSQVLELVAPALLVVGFAGALAEGVAPVRLDSPFSYLFYAGIASAFVAVYLAIFLHEDVEE
ncbi:hypothetical protein [Halovivax limisalsi]|uniref:hypothetical protein n=1 Tax=Halovivax limisalsi TaxID=1453760 RepID=UPI001FFD7F24|nr:hypothetical protein [Halovivax limisalsi]